MTTPLVTSDSAISFEMRNPSENTASTTLSPPQSPPLDTCQDIRLDIPFTQPSSPTPAYPIQSLAFQNQHHNQFLMDRRQRLLSWKDFSGEVRARLDVQHLLSKSSVLLDVHDSDLRAILRRMVEELPVDRRSSSPSKPILYPNLHNKLFSIADVDHFRVTNIEQRIQSIIASDEGVFEDQSWFTLYCTSEDVVETRLCFARLHKPTNFGPGLGDVQFIVLVIGPIQQKASMSLAPATVPTAVNVGVRSPSSLYVGDLHPDVTEAMLFEKFSAVGPVLSIRVCRDAVSRASLGYAYVNFQLHADAERVLNDMNFDLILNKPIRIMWSQRDPTMRRSGSGNVFIKNLNKNIDTKSIYDTFSMFGNIVSCKVATDLDGNSRGYGFIHFELEEAARKAIDKVNGMLLEGKPIYVGKFLPKAARLRELGDSAVRFNNIYVKNFAQELDTDKLQTLFEQFGTITSAVVMTDENSKSRGFGFVCFEKPEDAEKAVTRMNNYQLPGTEQKLTVCPLQTKSERQAEMKRRLDQMKLVRMNRYQGVNLYVKNLDDTITDETLRQSFEPYGAITSAKVMCYDNGISKGFGFVCFEKPDDATKAVLEMNNKMIGSKPLYVALAQRKEERKAQLATHYMQRLTAVSLVNQRGVPGSVYNTASQSSYFVPPQPIPMPGQRVASYMAPQPMYTTQIRNPSYQWTGAGNIGRNSATQNGYSMQGIQGRSNFSYGNGMIGNRQNRMGSQNFQRSQNNQSYRMKSNYGGNNGPRHENPVNVYNGESRDVITSQMLSSLSSTEQKQLIGERLYMKIKTICNIKEVDKITGMLLEMEVSDLLALLENDTDLQTRVNEALTVFHSAKKNQP